MHAEGMSAVMKRGPVDLEGMERTLIENALKQAGHNRSKAARLLGLSRSKLYTRMERFGLA